MGVLLSWLRAAGELHPPQLTRSIPCARITDEGEVTGFRREATTTSNRFAG